MILKYNCLITFCIQGCTLFLTILPQELKTKKKRDLKNVAVITNHITAMTSISQFKAFRKADLFRIKKHSQNSEIPSEMIKMFLDTMFVW